MNAARGINDRKILQSVVFTIVTAAFSLMFYFYPYIGDNLWFLSAIHEHATKCGHPSTLLYGLYGAGKYHYLNDNARLANTILPGILLLPKWIPVLISTISFALTYALVLKFGNISSFTGFTVSTLLLCIALPWHDSMFITMFTMNYVWTGALMLFSIWWFLNGKHHILSSLILGIFMGVSHECFSIPLLFAFCCLIFLKKRKINAWRIAIMAGLLIGIIILYTTPAFIPRAASFVIKGASPNRLNYLSSEISYYIYLIGWLVFALQKQYRERAFSTMQVVCLSLGFAVIPIHMFCYSPRATYPLVLVSIIGLLNLPWSDICHINKWIKAAGCLLIYLFLSCHLYIACKDIYRLNNEMNAIFASLENQKPGQTIIYTDITYPHQLSWLSLCKMNFWNTTQQLTYKWYAEITGLPRCGVVPKVLKDYTGQYDEMIPGNAGAKLYKGLAILPLINFPGHVDRSKIYAQLAGRERAVGSEYFVGKDGKEYLVIIPFIRISDFSHKIQQINAYQ